MMQRPLPARNHVSSRHLLAFVLAVGAALVASAAFTPDALARGKKGRGKGAAAAEGGGGAGRGTTKVGVLNFTGPGEAASRAAASKALSSKKIVVVPGGQLDAAAQRLHVRLEDDAGFKAVARQLKLTAFVTGEVSKKKATLTVRTGSDGSVVGEESFLGPNPKKVAAVVGKTFWKRLAGAFNKTSAPTGGGGAAEEEPSAPAAVAEAEEPPASRREKAAPPPEREEAPPAAAEPEESPRKKEAVAEAAETGGRSRTKRDEEGAPPPKKARPRKEAAEAPELPDEQPSADIAVGVADLMRSLAYNQLRNDLTQDHKVANYSLPKAPLLYGKLDVFPFALMGSEGTLADVGLALDFGYLLPVVTSPGNGGSYKTASLGWALGPKMRLPYGLYGTIAYGNHWFKLVRSNADMDAAPVVETNYTYVRLGTGIRRQIIDVLSVSASLAYDYCLGKPGQIASAEFFPKTTCAGLELGVGAGYKITDSIELRAGVDLQRFGLAFHNNKNDIDNTHPIAGGALDQYINLYLTVAYVIGGSSSDGGGGEKAKAPSKGKSGGDDDDDDDDDDDGK